MNQNSPSGGHADSGAAALKTLLLSDLVNSTKLVEELGDEAAARLFAAHDRIARDLLLPHHGREIDKTDGFLLLFDRPLEAVRYAMEYHRALKELSAEKAIPLAARIGIHVGEVFLRSNSPEDISRGAKPLEVEGLAKPMAARLMSLAMGGQTLLTAAAFDLARRAAVSDRPEATQLQWLAHGAYFFKGVTEAVEVFEAGIPGISPLTAPEGSAKVRKAGEDGVVPGWRPAPGQGLPERPNWILREKLGEGGFGEVWLGVHRKTGDRHVFKFCFDSKKLRSLQREVTFFRLMRENLGNREDIARILDWNFDEAPYFLEVEFSEGGSLEDWAEDQGGIGKVRIEDRLELVAQVADALAAAHSIGVLHKDLKPANILIDTRGKARARLTDFGISAITDPSHALASGITMLGFTGSVDEDMALTGTRMYMAPELLEGKPATIQADLYALGVLLYQVAAGDLHRAMASGWERDISDPVLADDIAALVDRSPERRPGDAAEVARRLRKLEERRTQRQEETRREEERIQARKALIRARRRRKLLIGVAAGLAVFAAAMGYQRMRIAEEAARAEANAMHALEQEEITGQVLKYLLDLFEGADPAHSRGRDISVRELLDRGTEKIEGELAGQPRVRARVMESLGAVYFKLGAYDRAEELWNSSLELRRKLGETAAPELASDLMSLASVRIAGGALGEAKKLLSRALETAEAAGAQKLQADIEANLGSIAFYEGDYASAETSWKKSLEIFETLGGIKALKQAQLLNNIARAERELGRLGEAEINLEKALEILTVAEGDDHPEVARIVSGLGDLALAEGDASRAEEMYRRALKIREKVLPADHPLLFSSLEKLARALAGKGDLEEAGDAARRATRGAAAKLGEAHPLVLECRLVSAEINRLKGAVEDSRHEAEEVLGIVQAHTGEDDLQRAPALRTVGLAQAAGGDFKGAEKTLAAVVDLYRKKAPDSLELADAEAELARVFLGQGRSKEGEDLLRNALEIRRHAAGEDAPITKKTAAELAAVGKSAKDGIPAP